MPEALRVGYRFGFDNFSVCDRKAKKLEKQQRRQWRPWGGLCEGKMWAKQLLRRTGHLRVGISDILTPSRGPMRVSNVEDEIAKLGDGVSEIYFNAKHELACMQDSRSERFSRAARIVRAFWKRNGIAQPHAPANPSSQK